MLEVKDLSSLVKTENIQEEIKVERDQLESSTLFRTNIKSKSAKSSVMEHVEL